MYLETINEGNTMAQRKIEMNLLRSTKNKHVYQCEAENTPIETVYVIRDELPKKAPPIMRVTIDYDE